MGAVACHHTWACCHDLVSLGDPAVALDSKAQGLLAHATVLHAWACVAGQGPCALVGFLFSWGRILLN